HRPEKYMEEYLQRHVRRIGVYLHSEGCRILAPVPLEVVLRGRDLYVLSRQANRDRCADAPVRVAGWRNVGEDSIIFLSRLDQMMLSQCLRSGNVCNEPRIEARSRCSLARSSNTQQYWPCLIPVNGKTRRFKYNLECRHAEPYTIARAKRRASLSNLLTINESTVSGGSIENKKAALLIPEIGMFTRNILVLCYR